MENTQTDPQQAVEQVYQYTADQLIQGRRRNEVIDMLTNQGIELSLATKIVNQTQDQISSAKKSQGGKDMVYGALWCVGGLALTMSGIGLIFWGAILFGAIQFFRGVANYTS